LNVSTPILLLVFNRPEHTRLVFEEIRKQQPLHLYIAADGPRVGNENDVLRCAEVKNIFNLIDWECSIKVRFNKDNQGTKYAVSSAITWFFEHVDCGIILEDDCLPNESFFEFSTEMLDRYASDPKIMMINGCSYQSRSLDGYDYYFSKYPHVWGWATWRRAWNLYHVELAGISDSTFRNVVASTFPLERERKHWIQNFKFILNGFDTWDYQWMFWIWKNDGLCITPWYNMISNIGFGKDATHTLDENSSQSKMPQYEVKISHHPTKIIQNTRADKLESYKIIISSPKAHMWQQTKAIVKTLINYKNGT